VGIISNTKLSLARFVLRNKLKSQKRKKQLVNLEEAKTIGVLYVVSSERTFKIIKELIKTLSSHKRQVLTIGYVNRKEIPSYCVAANSGYYFNKNELNWLGMPKNDYLNKFIDQEIDILIDLSRDDIFVLDYITSLSRAKFKIGQFVENDKNRFDFMIKAKKDISFESFIDQILHYSMILKSK
jgi:hypothetical protein